MKIKKLTREELKAAIGKGASLIDMRPAMQFCDAFIPGSIHLSDNARDDTLSIVNTELPVIMISEPGGFERHARALEDKGFSSISAYFDEDLAQWFEEGNPVDVVISVDPEELAIDMKYSDPEIADIRDKEDFDKQHLTGALNLPFDELISAIDELPQEEMLYMYCEDGEQSLSLITYLRLLNMNNIYHVRGGLRALLFSGAPTASEQLN